MPKTQTVGKSRMSFSVLIILYGVNHIKKSISAPICFSKKKNIASCASAYWQLYKIVLGLYKKQRHRSFLVPMPLALFVF